MGISERYYNPFVMGISCWGDGILDRGFVNLLPLLRLCCLDFSFYLGMSLFTVVGHAAIMPIPGSENPMHDII